VGVDEGGGEEGEILLRLVGVGFVAHGGGSSGQVCVAASAKALSVARNEGDRARRLTGAPIHGLPGSKVIYKTPNALLSVLEKGLWGYFAPHCSHRMQCDKAAFT
jgi:hypothetical protein